MKKTVMIFLMVSVVSVFVTADIISADQATRYDTYKASIVDVPIRGKVLIITDNDYNDTELLYPYYRFVEEGYEVTIATLKGGDVAGYNTAPVKNTVPVDQINPEDYVGLYLPGGRAPSVLRENEKVIEIVNHFIFEGKPVAAICHGPLILAGAGALKNRLVTAWPDTENEMVQSGAVFLNEPVVVDGTIVTARMPGDLPPHLHTFLKMLE